MTFPLDNEVFARLTGLAECLCAQLAADGLPDVCFCGVIAGSEPYDASGIGECGELNGQAWVRLVNAYPSSGVGVPDLNVGNCNKGLGIDLEIGVLRYFPIEENGGSLEVTEMLVASQLQIADMISMQRAVVCCPAISEKDYIMNTYTPIGPDGGLLGGSWTLSMAI